MRTTLDIADDVLIAAKEIARRDNKSLGQTISELARRAFAQGAASGGSVPPGAEPAAASVSERLADYGIRPLQARGGMVSNALVDGLRDAEGI